MLIVRKTGNMLKIKVKIDPRPNNKSDTSRDARDTTSSQTLWLIYQERFQKDKDAFSVWSWKDSHVMCK
jgi:hypothetical protein